MSPLAILVPARLASTRFPRKLLHPIRGRPLILHVARRLAAEVPEIPRWFAVDSEELGAVLTADGHRVVLTDPALPSGTDRIAVANREVVRAGGVINVQADEPLVTGRQVRALAGLLEAGFEMATLGTPFRTAADFAHPNQVKVVAGAEGAALYFSRAPIPWPRDAGGPGGVDAAWFERHGVLRHLGLYAYTADLLARFTAWPPGRLEEIERLEQLRALERGVRIGVGVTREATVGIDAPEDVAAYEARLDAEAGGAAAGG